ncbi:protein TolR [Bartonella tamiae]|uniref:Protein TolR n=1 Tax=Bartonella tamiae Th239 TaxID=1094558 RepID=J1K3L7_9HYPH|nr:protein TolR [Bartonella tamiae]EJF91735.1 protein TolR [Bartonella tamiae Th239]EJF92597.1 protein TolR [Bartonella tamiae Th307]
MGMSLGSSQRGSRRSSRRGRGHGGLMSEINVTPFVDVMLVLLIIFMVSAPLLVNGVPLDLPQTQAGPINADTQPLTVSIDDEGKFAVNEEYYTTAEEVIAKLKAVTDTGSEASKQRIVVRGAKMIEYQKILDLLATIQKAGFSNVALASLPQQ